jgi:hypothetical protein
MVTAMATVDIPQSELNNAAEMKIVVVWREMLSSQFSVLSLA